MKKTAWVAGASGLIGGHLMTLLSQSANYEKVVALVREPVDTDWAKADTVEQWSIDYDKLALPDPETRVNHVFCALGSTTKKTPNKHDYYKIDVDYPLKIAELGREQGAQFFGLVSAHGANARSLSSYLKMKGKLERLLQKLDYPRLAFARPSLLIGEREEHRPLEKFSESFMRAMPGNYKAIAARDVAAALITEANDIQPVVRILTSSDMQGASKNA